MPRRSPPRLAEVPHRDRPPTMFPSPPPQPGQRVDRRTVVRDRAWMFLKDTRVARQKDEPDQPMARGALRPGGHPTAHGYGGRTNRLTDVGVHDRGCTP